MAEPSGGRVASSDRSFIRSLLAPRTARSSTSGEPGEGSRRDAHLQIALNALYDDSSIPAYQCVLIETLLRQQSEMRAMLEGLLEREESRSSQKEKRLAAEQPSSPTDDRSEPLVDAPATKHRASEGEGEDEEEAPREQPPSSSEKRRSSPLFHPRPPPEVKQEEERDSSEGQEAEESPSPTTIIHDSADVDLASMFAPSSTMRTVSGFFEKESAAGEAGSRRNSADFSIGNGNSTSLLSHFQQTPVQSLELPASQTPMETPLFEDFLLAVSKREDAVRRNLAELGIPARKMPTGYQCGVCFLWVRTFTRLQEHACTHTGDRQHGCRKCTRRFNRKDNLRNHEKRVHPELFESPTQSPGRRGRPRLSTLESAKEDKKEVDH